MPRVERNKIRKKRQNFAQGSQHVSVPSASLDYGTYIRVCSNVASNSHKMNFRGNKNKNKRRVETFRPSVSALRARALHQPQQQKALSLCIVYVCTMSTAGSSMVFHCTRKLLFLVIFLRSFVSFFHPQEKCCSLRLCIVSPYSRLSAVGN